MTTLLWRKAKDLNSSAVLPLLMVPTETQLPRTLREDARVTKLLAEGWVFHANFDPKKPGDLESTIHTSVSFHVRPSNAREVLIIDVAYDVEGKPRPGYNAMYMRDFKQPEERHEFGRSLSYMKFV